MKTLTMNNRMKVVVFAVLLLVSFAFQVSAKELNSFTMKNNSIEKIKPVPVGGAASILNKISYPNIAEKLGMEGQVKLQALINENGDVEKVIVLKGLGAGCEEEAMNALKTTKFVPGSENGKSIKSVYPLTVMFKIDRTGN